jgi:predicted enzyme related to lactoylglutathione lyase
MGNPVVHFEIGCEDSQQAESFYGLLFGWTSRPYGTSSVSMSTGSDRGIQGHITALGHEPHHYVMFYVEVDDIESYCERAESLGGHVVVPATQLPQDGGRFAWLADPEGNHVGLLEAG